LFGTGLTRPLEDIWSEILVDLAARSRIVIACDLPSGVETDGGAFLSPVPHCDLTVTFGALKPAHRLMPAMARMGRVVLADIGIEVSTDWQEIGRPQLPPLLPEGHKFDRGLVHALSGKMPGAIALAARAAARAGAGYVRISTSRSIENLPSAIVQTDTATLEDPRIGAVLVGPGMGDIPQILTLALTSKAPVVIDADGIGHVGEPERLKGHDAVITPHEGEFVRLFGELPGSKAQRAGGGGPVGRCRGLQRRGHFGCGTRRPAELRSARSGLAGECRERRRAGRYDRIAKGARHGRIRSRLGGGLAARPGRGDRRAEHDRRRSGRGPAGRARTLPVSEPFIRIAARGDGVTASGRHAAFAAPGDHLREDGTVEPGPNHQQPPCRHFPECGGCQLQHVTDNAYRAYLHDRVAGALAQHGLETEIREPHLSPPRSRRRATLRAINAGKSVMIGFNAARSKRIIDMRECHILRPELFDLIEPLRKLLGGPVQVAAVAEIRLTLADQGVDVLFSDVVADGLEAAEALPRFGEDQGLARLSVDDGYGVETRYEPSPVTVTLSGVPVVLPAGAFLQATDDGEAALVDAVREAVAGCNRTADLFAGIGTFALALQGQVTAAEASRDAVLTLQMAARRAARQVNVEHRDLYRRPYDSKELSAFDAVVLDPPRAGAEEQVKQLAASAVPRIAYVSCNPATFARDAAILAAGGYRLEWVRPVGQFRWSTHIELAACFSR
jgi:23S rRNA (uracil1939-C5)-methyltransferase